MQSSSAWHTHFVENEKNLLPVPWHLGAELTEEESAAIASSVQGFQLGESSEGRHLYKYAKQYSEATGDAQYVQAIRLFIAEEQRHGRELGRFLKANNIPLIKETFPDRVFRKLRNIVGSLEISIGVLVTAEIYAMVYYDALKQATESRILKTLCNQILHDEIYHLEFQCQQLGKLRVGRSGCMSKLTMGLQRFLFLGTFLVVWLYHHKSLRRGGYSLQKFWRASWREFNDAFVITEKTISELNEQQPTQADMPETV